MDSGFGLRAHVNMVCRSAYYHLWNIGRVRKYLDTKSAKMAVHSLVTSRLDYHNGLLYGLPAGQLEKLQCVQNSAARVVSRACKRDHITPVLHALHWLPVSYRLQFKLLTLTYKAMHGEGPAYMQDMLTPYRPARSLRSGGELLLKVPRSLSRAGDRAFSVAAPTLWNRLPLAIRQASSTNIFKKRLKTLLFNAAFH